MKSNLLSIQHKLGKPYLDLEFLLNCFREVLLENSEKELAKQIPWISTVEPDFSNHNQEKLWHMYSICFQLLNLAEVNGAVQNRRNKQEKEGFESVNGLWGSVFSDLKNSGFDEKQIIDQFRNVQVEPVLTAHPTEAKRPVVLGLYRELYLLLVKRENTMYTSYEQKEFKNSIKEILHKLWFIGEIFIEKPAIESELENVIHYFVNVFPDVLHYLDLRLHQAWDQVGFNTRLIEDTSIYPAITFGNWVGGDRDGHPLVTSRTTDYTLKRFRLYALKLAYANLENLSEKLSIYIDENSLQPQFLVRLRSLKDEISDSYTYLKSEPFRYYIQLLKRKLPVAEQASGDILLKDSDNSYKTSEELINDLKILKKAVKDYGANVIASTDVQKMIRHLKVFGFHLAHLDIRQNSKYNQEALLEIIKTSLPSKFLEISKSAKSYEHFIHNELENNRPFINRIDFLTSEKAREVLETFHTLADFIHKYILNVHWDL